jgi:hydrogenase maturation protease
MDELRRIADAVLYEGYILWPYTRSATKNRQRWTFGGVYPPRHSAEHPDDLAELRCECLLEGDAPVDVHVRFLQVVRRQLVLHGEPVDELTVGGERYLSWDEAVERELPAGAIAIPAGSDEEPLGDAAAIVRSWESLDGTIDVGTRYVPGTDGLSKVSVRVANATPWDGDDRDDALRRTFCSTHVVLRAETGAFVSLTDPPDRFADAAAACENAGVWPVLVGDERTLLAAPIILSDYPQIAPESPGDLFDATEIDRMLILNVMSLTPEEQAEMRATDPRAREILDRCAALSTEELLRLHGTMR